MGIRHRPDWVNDQFEAKGYSDANCDFGTNFHCKHCNWVKDCSDGGIFMLGQENDHYYEALLDMKSHLVEKHGFKEEKLPLFFPPTSDTACFLNTLVLSIKLKNRGKNE